MPGVLGGLTSTLFGVDDLFAPRTEGQYAGVDRNSFNLPGADTRGQRDTALGNFVSGRGAPQASDSAFRDNQRHLANALEQTAFGQGPTMSQLAFRGMTDQGIAQQRALAASSAPGNAAMAQRLAGQNIGRMNQGFGSQSAMLGIQERNAAQNALANLAGQARGQDLGLSQFNAGAQLQQTGLNDQAQNNAYNRELGNAQLQQQGGMGYEANRTSRASGMLAQPTMGEQLLGAGMGAAAMFAKSDVRLKQDIRPGGGDANRFMDSLSPASYQYKPGAGMPPGQHTGVMAQQLEQTPAGRGAVINTPQGKMVDYGQLGGVTMASLASLNDRLKAIEEHAGISARTKQTASGKKADAPAPLPRQNFIDPDTGEPYPRSLQYPDRKEGPPAPLQNYDRATNVYDFGGDILGRERAPIRGR